MEGQVRRKQTEGFPIPFGSLLIQISKSLPEAPGVPAIFDSHYCDLKINAVCLSW